MSNLKLILTGAQPLIGWSNATIVIHHTSLLNELVVKYQQVEACDFVQKIRMEKYGKMFESLKANCNRLGCGMAATQDPNQQAQVRWNKCQLGIIPSLKVLPCHFNMFVSWLSAFCLVNETWFKFETFKGSNCFLRGAQGPIFASLKGLSLVVGAPEEIGLPVLTCRELISGWFNCFCLFSGWFWNNLW